MPDYNLNVHVHEGTNEGPQVEHGQLIVKRQVIPLVHGEALYNRPVIATRVPGFADYDSAPDGYYLTDPNTPTPIAQQRRVPPRLRIEGGRFVTDEGPLFILTRTDFLLVNRVARGEDVTPNLRYWFDLGFEEARVLVFAKNIPEQLGWPVLRPEAFGSEFWPALKHTAELAAAHSQRLKICVCADMQLIDGARDLGYQQDMVYRVADTVKDLTNCRIQFGNQWIKNGFDPRLLQKLEGTGLLFSRGSTAERWEPPTPPLDWSDWDAGRNTKFTDSESLLNIATGNIHGDHRREYGAHPCDSNEPMGFAEEPRPFSRSTDPNLARAIRAEAEAFADAVCFHSTAGVYSQIPGPITERCARNFAEARP